MTAPQTPHCPVCRARFRAERHCRRCGADLSALMVLAAKAFLLRQAARQALRDGRFEDSNQLAVKAQRLCDTRAGRQLRGVTAWLR